MRLGRLASVLSVLVSLNLAAHAGTVNASGAGPLLPDAQDLTSVEVTEILGNLSSDLDAVSLFKIHILNTFVFSALTANTGPFGIPDTELFLFDAAGFGIYFNDDRTVSDTLSCLPAALLNPCPSPTGGFGPVLPGIYYLGITRSANGPLDAKSNEIFANSLSTDVVGPNSGAGALAGWDNGAFTQPNFDLVNYDIVLNGTTPEPATWRLLAGALLAAGVIRRKRLCQ